MAKLNFLFIIFDDLRPELSIYNRPHMITPNFERLANRSVIFDKVFAQIAVCNPSRDSLLTGLRPDTVGTYSFQSCFRPHYVFQNQFVKAGYKTAGYGKVAHWDGNDKELWSEGFYEGDWYGYQNNERNFMNSSTMPDKVWPDEKFRDYMFATMATKKLESFIQDKSNNFMLGVGFKNPHLQIHMPYEYYDMYKNKTDAFILDKKELRFPHSSPDVAYRCCAEPKFMYMNKEGAEKASNIVDMGNINMVINDKMREEMMIGYAASITFVDKQLGRLLDVMDKYDAWKNTVVILTADHGMHNGEKGIWEKWSMFDESTRVPLIIHHPSTPYPGQHYTDPVELIDVYPTIVDLLALPYNHNTYCTGEKFFNMNKVCHQLQGKSLAKVVLGENLYNEYLENNKIIVEGNQNRLKVEKVTLISAKEGGHGLKVVPVVKVRGRLLRNETWSELLDDTFISPTAVASATATAEYIETSTFYRYYPANLHISHQNGNNVHHGHTHRHLSHLSTEYIDSYNYVLDMIYNHTNPSHNLAYTPHDHHHHHGDVFDTNTHSKSIKKNTDHHRYLQSLITSTSSSSSSSSSSSLSPMPKLEQTFAISQSLRCAKVDMVKKAIAWQKESGKGERPYSHWFDCDKTKTPTDEISVMGYSLRTNEYRYTTWFHYNRHLCLPILDTAPFDEELYDHRKETLADFTHLETVNLARKSGFHDVLISLRMKLIDYVRTKIIFRGCFRDSMD